MGDNVLYSITDTGDVFCWGTYHEQAILRTSFGVSNTFIQAGVSRGGSPCIKTTRACQTHHRMVHFLIQHLVLHSSKDGWMNT